MPYTTEQKVKDYLQIDNFTHSRTASRISDWIEAVEEWIDHYCGRTFKVSLSETRLYDGPGEREIIVDDFTTLSKIEFLDLDGDVDDETSDSTDWKTYPANKKPKNRIYLNPGGDFQPIFPKGHQNIRITAHWGYLEVPKAIEMAATMLVAEIVRDFDQKTLGEIKGETIGDYSVSFATIEQRADRLGVKEMLNAYRRIWI